MGVYVNTLLDLIDQRVTILKIVNILITAGDKHFISKRTKQTNLSFMMIQSKELRQIHLQSQASVPFQF
jgi:hypothetical protein